MQTMEAIIAVVLDCFEEFFETFDIAAGKKMWQVFGVIFCIFITSIIGQAVGAPIWCNWYEALMALIIVGAIACIGTVTSSDVGKVVGFLKEQASIAAEQSTSRQRQRPNRRKG